MEGGKKALDALFAAPVSEDRLTAKQERKEKKKKIIDSIMDDLYDKVAKHVSQHGPIADDGEMECEFYLNPDWNDLFDGGQPDVVGYIRTKTWYILYDMGYLLSWDGYAKYNIMSATLKKRKP